ncbi:MAG: lysophospholipase L1-like esterase [Paraglaciecola sp.]
MTKPLSVIPTKRYEDWWLKRHQQKLTELRVIDKPVDIVFLGDSITHAWEVEGEESWRQHFAQRKALNLGYAGDRTEHLLWRILNGEINSLSPKWVVLLIGTNNAGHRHDSPQEIAAGVKVILGELKQRLPDSKILLMAIFPRSRNRSKRMRKRVDSTNTLIKEYSDGKQVLWLDINHHFLTDEGVLLESVMPDLLHPNAAQYYLWAKAVLSFI